MADITETPIKDILRNKYINLTEEELKIEVDTLVQEANSPQDAEFKFTSWGQDKGGDYAICLSSDGNIRYFFVDAIKKSSKQILKEVAEAKKKIKDANNKIKKALEEEKESKRKAREDEKAAKEREKKKKAKYLNKKLKNKRNGKKS